MSAGCADLADARGEPLRGTASPVDRWLLVEHPGGWEQAAPPLTRLPAAGALQELAHRHRARLLLLRRPQRRTTPGRWVFAAVSTPGQEALWSHHLDDDSDLSSLTWPGGGTAWQQEEQRLWLVCTHGGHDSCCALRGRPLANAMLAHDPERVWECSHVGGDRFAPNLVLLPEGHFLGRVRPDQVPALLDGVREERLDPSVWRGRSSLPLPVQAAQSFLAADLPSVGLRDLTVLAQDVVDEDVWRIVLAGPDGEVEVVVRYDRASAPARLTCAAQDDRVAPVFRLVSLSTGPLAR